MLRDELWETITESIAVPIPSDPEQPFLFPLFHWVDLFLCFACIERRLGRQLTQEDLNTSVWNAGWIHPPADYALPFDCRHSAKAQWARWARGRRLLPHSGGAR